MLSFRMFALSLDGFPSPISPAPSAPFGISSSFTSFTSFTSPTSSISCLSARAQHIPQRLSSHRNPAPTRHIRHAGAPATPSFSCASALFPSYRGCASCHSTKNPLLFPSAFLTPLLATLTNPSATVASKRLPGTLNLVDATLTKNPGEGLLLGHPLATHPSPLATSASEGALPLYPVLVLELDCGQDFDPARDADFFAALPPRPAVCLIESRAENAEPFLIRTQDLRRRLQRLLGPPDSASKRLNLRELARGIRYRLTGSALEQIFTYYQHAKHLFPNRYRKLTRLRPPAVLKISLRNAYPRCYVTRRISVNDTGAPAAGAYYGPFPSRKSALAFSVQALDLFKVRRCQIKIRRDPTFPGCIYSEMKMCLAPCFAGCTKEEYDAEVQRLVQFLDTHGNSLRTAVEADRER